MFSTSAGKPLDVRVAGEARSGALVLGESQTPRVGRQMGPDLTVDEDWLLGAGQLLVKQGERLAQAGRRGGDDPVQS